MVSETVWLTQQKEQEARRKEAEAKQAEAKAAASAMTAPPPPSAAASEPPQSGYNDKLSSLPNIENMGFGQIIVLFLAMLLTKLGDNSFFAGLFGKMTEDVGRQKGDNLYINRRPSVSHDPEKVGSGSYDASKPVDLKDFSLSKGGWPDDIKFVRAYKRGADVVYIGQNGEELVKHRENTQAASRSWVNNNPGNIEYGKFARAQGAIGTDGRFAIFASPKDGMKAQAALLQSENYRNLTLEAAIHRYAPKSENDTEAYIRFVEKTAGVSRNTRMGDLDTGKMMTVVSAMAKHEGWKEGKLLGKGLDTAPQGDVPPATWDQKFATNGGPVILGLPLDSKKTSSFGPRNIAVEGASNKHCGLDMRAAVGTPLVAQGPAQVAYAGPSGGYGQAVILNHGQGVFTLYGHVEPNMPARTGQMLKAGDRFAVTGDEGVGAAHLHFEVLLQGRDGRAYRVDPEQAVGKNLADPAVRQALIAQASDKMGVDPSRLASRAFDARVDDDHKHAPVQLAQAAQAPRPETPRPAVAERTPEPPATPRTTTSVASAELGKWLSEKLPGIAHIFEGNADPSKAKPDDNKPAAASVAVAKLDDDNKQPKVGAAPAPAPA